MKSDKWYILDSKIISKLVDGSISVNDLPSDYPYVALHTQLEKLGETDDIQRRAELLMKFSRFDPAALNTERVTLTGQTWERINAWDSVRLRKLTDDLTEAYNEKPRLREVLLAEIAIEYGLTLVTLDRTLAQIICSHGGSAVFFET